MQFEFDTDNVKRGEAALLLYAMYRSRNTSTTPLTGKETWSRFAKFIKGAALKSATTAEFCDNFCKMAHVESIKPAHLKSGAGYIQMPDGSIIESENVTNFQTKIFEDNELMPLFQKESQILIMLIRERIQREKIAGIADNEEDAYNE